VEIDDLYGLPLEDFTAARNALAKERPEAKGLRKPSIAAWAVNQLARRHRGELDSFLDAASELRRAQTGGGDVRAATTAERSALTRLLQLAGEYAGAAQSERIRQTLQAAAVDEEAADQVRAGRLERELEPAGFGTLVAGPAPKRRAPAPKRDRAAERAAVEAARKAVREAKADLRDAEAQEREAERALEQAHAEAERARVRADEAEAALAEAQRRAR